MPRTKGSKNRVTASTDFDAQIAKLQKDKAMLEEGLSKTVAHIEELGKTMATQKMCPLAYPNFCKWHGCIPSDADFIHILGSS